MHQAYPKSSCSQHQAQYALSPKHNLESIESILQFPGHLKPLRDTDCGRISEGLSAPLGESQVSQGEASDREQQGRTTDLSFNLSLLILSVAYQGFCFKHLKGLHIFWNWMDYPDKVLSGVN